MRSWHVALLLLAWGAILLPQAISANRLKDHPSAYLALHGADPVDWQEWGPEALAMARRENKPLFVSSGYFACHWCHVMQQESYSNKAIAALLNQYFVPVKVDRELLPALDAYLIHFVEVTRGSAGWPLNVFLSPEGYPLLGLTYAAPDTFHRLLVRLSGAWLTQHERLSAMARQAAAELGRLQEHAPEALPADLAPLLSRLRDQALSMADELQGGFGHQSRFPMAPQFEALLELQGREPNPRLERFLRLTLTEMASQGMRDHLEGGFFRYTVDPGWQTPHFEKMLYDQALNTLLYLQAARVLEAPEYRAVARDTLDFVVKRMRSPNGGYIASFSAVDQHGVEGGNYLWTPEQLAGLLDQDERRLAGLIWGLRDPPNNEGGYLPVAAADLEESALRLGLEVDAARAMMERIRAKLLLARAARPLPRDAKPVAAWNGLALSALAAGVRTFGDAYRDAAAGLADFLSRRLWDGKRLYRSFSDQGWMGEAALEDYAFVARGLADWSAAAGTPAARRLALELVRIAWDRFYSDGWRNSAEHLVPGMGSESAMPDSPLPAPSATLIRLTRELADPVADRALLQRAEKALALAYPLVSDAPFGYAGTVQALWRWRDRPATAVTPVDHEPSR